MASKLAKLRSSLARNGLVPTAQLVLKNLAHTVRAFSPAQVRARRIQRAFDAAYGVDTSGYVWGGDLDVDSDLREHITWYEPTPPDFFREMIERLEIRASDYTFLDIGSGKGRTLLIAAELGFKQVIGIEVSKSLHEIAIDNVRRFRQIRPASSTIVCLHEDANHFALPPGPLVIFLFNPFDETVMTNVVRNVRVSLESEPREVIVLYYYPRLAAMFTDSGLFSEAAQGWNYKVLRHRT